MDFVAQATTCMQKGLPQRRGVCLNKTALYSPAFPSAEEKVGIGKGFE